MKLSTDAWFTQMVNRSGFLDRFPYYSGVLAKLEIVDDEECGYMAVSNQTGRLQLHINREAFEKEPEGFPGILQHECHHVIQGHPTDPRLHDVDKPLLMRIAMEISANADIQLHLPGNPYRWQQYKDIGIQHQQTTMQRYHILERAYEEGRLPSSFVIQGDCGCGNENSPGLPIESFNVPPPPGQPGNGRARNKGGGMGGKLGQKPKTESVENGGDATLEWGSELRRFARRERVRSISMRRPNRRQPERIGEIPGYQRRPTLSKLLIAIDTSGSMQKQIFQAIDGELSGLADLATLEICEVDDEIRRTYAYKGRLRDIQGRGGTDFHPVFAERFLAQRRGLSGIVYFTDGKGPYPNVGPRIPVLWVLIGGRKFSCPWGGQVRLRT